MIHKNSKKLWLKKIDSQNDMKNGIEKFWIPKVYKNWDYKKLIPYLNVENGINKIYSQNNSKIVTIRFWFSKKILNWD